MRSSYYKLSNSWVLAVLLVPIIVTWLVNVTSTRSVFYIGHGPDYFGYCSWVGVAALGFVLAHYLQRYLFSTPVVLIGGLLLVASLLAGAYDIGHGFKMPGIFFQPRSMACMANIIVIICLHRLRAQSLSRKMARLIWVILSVAAAAVVFTQSKLGLMVLLGVLIIWVIFNRRLNFISRRLLAITVISLSLIHIVLPNYFSGFNSESVTDGLAYRPVLTFNTFYGSGPASLPRNIDNQNLAPPDVVKSLDQPERFSANHNLFIDSAYFFGRISFVFLISLNLLAFYRSWQRRAQFALEYVLIFLVLLINSLFNAPELLLSSLYFTFLYSSLIKHNGAKSNEI